jgi:hypothetical protein
VPPIANIIFPEVISNASWVELKSETIAPAVSI